MINDTQVSVKSWDVSKSTYIVLWELNNSRILSLIILIKTTLNSILQFSKHFHIIALGLCISPEFRHTVKFLFKDVNSKRELFHDMDSKRGCLHVLTGRASSLVEKIAQYSPSWSHFYFCILFFSLPSLVTEKNSFQVMFDFVVQIHLSSYLSLEVLSSFPLAIVDLCWGLQSNGHPQLLETSLWALHEVLPFRVSMLTFFHPSLSDLPFCLIFSDFFQHKTVFGS